VSEDCSTGSGAPAGTNVSSLFADAVLGALGADSWQLISVAATSSHEKRVIQLTTPELVKWRVLPRS
jgi:hypothetical protein